MVEDFSFEEGLALSLETAEPESVRPDSIGTEPAKKPGRKAALLATALALFAGEEAFSQQPKVSDIDSIVLKQPDVQNALKKRDAAFEAVKSAESEVIQASKAIMRTQSDLDAAMGKFKKKRTPTFREEVAQARVELQKARDRKGQAIRLVGGAGDALVQAEWELSAILELKHAEEVLRRAQEKARVLNIADATSSKTHTALAQPGKTTATETTAGSATPRGKNISIGLSAGPTFSFLSSGDNAVESPGVMARADLKGVFRPSNLLGAEVSYTPTSARLSTKSPKFHTRDFDQRLDGGMAALRVVAMRDFPFVENDTLDASLRVGGGLGVAATYVEGGTDVGIARAQDAEGRREFANLPPQIMVLPFSALSAGLVVETRDGITGAIQGSVTLGAYPNQINPGDPARYHSLFYDVSAAASVGYKFH